MRNDFSISVPITQIVNINMREVETIVNEYLDKLKEGRWIENGKLMQEVYTSHRFDVVCDDQSDLALIEAIQTLQKILKASKAASKK